MSARPSETAPTGPDLLLANLPLMRAVVGRFFAAAADRDDALQDAAVAVVRGAGRFGGRATFGTWVYRVTCNACLMRRRGDRRRARREGTPDGSAARRREADGPLDALARRETVRLVRAAVDGLPATYREILTLRSLQELDVSECAARLGVSEEAVRARSLRARRQLERQLAVLAD